MYRKDKPINLKGSTSSLCNNLSVYVMPDKRQINYCVVHKSVINIACATTDGSSVTGRHVICKEPSATQGVPFVTQAKWAVLPSRTVLVLTTQRGIQIYEQDGSAMIHWHSLSDSMEKSNFAKGIAGVGDSLLCVGTEDGSILVFDLPSKGTTITLAESLKEHRNPITEMTSENDILVSGDEMGTINIWKFSGSRGAKMTSISGAGWPCNSLALWRDVIVAGYASGHLRVFNASNGKIGAEVSAHARAVNAVDIAPESGVVVSVSDDTFFRIWQLKPQQKPSGVPQGEYSQPSLFVQDKGLSRDGGRFQTRSPCSFIHCLHLRFETFFFSGESHVLEKQTRQFTQSLKIEFRNAENVQDLQLVGGKFIDGQGRALCVSGYDNSDLLFYIRG